MAAPADGGAVEVPDQLQDHGRIAPFRMIERELERVWAAVGRPGRAGGGSDAVGPVRVTRFVGVVIRSLGDRRTTRLWVNGTEHQFPPDVARRAVRKLAAVDAATTIDDLRLPPGHRLRALGGDRAGPHCFSANDQRRVRVRLEDDDAFEVEVCDDH